MLTLFPLLGLLLAVVSESPATTTPDADRRATQLYRLTKFVQWPDTAFSGPGAPLRICMVGGPIDTSLRALEGRRARGRDLEVREVAGPTRIAGCHLAVFPEVDVAVDGVIRPGVLTVGRGAGFTRAGGMIGLVEQDGRLGFSINAKSTKSAGIRVSSKLLQLADIVGGVESRR